MQPYVFYMHTHVCVHQMRGNAIHTHSHWPRRPRTRVRLFAHISFFKIRGKEFCGWCSCSKIQFPTTSTPVSTLTVFARLPSDRCGLALCQCGILSYIILHVNSYVCTYTYRFISSHTQAASAQQHTEHTCFYCCCCCGVHVTSMRWHRWWRFSGRRSADRMHQQP